MCHTPLCISGSFAADLTAATTWDGFRGCDDEHPQAHCRVGYDYLTRQVAALDATEKGHLALASYYTERGETPGVWMGSGMAGIDGLNPGDVVTAEQMRTLFGVIFTRFAFIGHEASHR